MNPSQWTPKGSYPIEQSTLFSLIWKTLWIDCLPYTSWKVRALVAES